MGGKAISMSKPVAQEDVATVVKITKQKLPKQLQNFYRDIGSAGYKPVSGDIDLMLEASDVVKFFNSPNTLAAKKALKSYFESSGIEAKVNGRNVSVGIEYSSNTQPAGYAQVDLMVIEDADLVAPYHQHGPRGMYEDPAFKGTDGFIVISSIAKYLGLKFDPFGAKLSRRDDNTVVARSRGDVAKIILGPSAVESDLNSVKTMAKALDNDPNQLVKLAEAITTLGAF